MMETVMIGVLLTSLSVSLLLTTGATGKDIHPSLRRCPPCNCTEKNVTGSLKPELEADCRNLLLHSVHNLTLPTDINSLLLSNNNLTGIRELDFGRYLNLTYLDLSFNIMEGVRQAVMTPRSYSNIRVLLLGHNNFTTITSSEFSQFPYLTRLDMSYNSIQKLTNGGFANLTKLMFLNLENNTLDVSGVPDDAFSNMMNLQILKLNNNSFSDYPEQALSRLTSLESLYIDGLQGKDFGPAFQNLTKLSHLILSGGQGNGVCNITILENSTFNNLGQVEHLDIATCNITNIGQEAFLPLTKLQSLDISGNYRLGFRNFSDGMCGISSEIKILKASNIVSKFTSCVIIGKEHIQYLSNTSLTHLYLDDNEIENIKLGVLPSLPPNLTFISAERNKFSYGYYIRELHTMKSLEIISLSGVSYPMNVPDYGRYENDYESCGSSLCTEDGGEELDFISSDIQSRENWQEHMLGGAHHYRDYRPFNLSLPPNLNFIRSNFTQMTFAIGRIVFEQNKIRHLDLSSNLMQFQKGELKGLENATYIDLSNNFAREMSKTLFKNCKELRVLNISLNFFGWQIQKDSNGTIFSHLTKLTHLVLSNNDMKGLSGHVFSNLSSLEELDVSSNGMFNFQPVLKNMKNLTVINCSNNQIKWLMGTTMDALSQIRADSKNFQLILRNNPLSCDCDGLETLTWLQTSGVTPQNMSGYYCLLNKVSMHISTTEDFEALIQKVTAQCKNHFGIALGCVAIFIAAMGLMVGAIMYRYRWKLRYLYYAARLRYLADKVPEEEDDEFVFDAFISYADEDRGFVINDMRSRLEHEASMKLNIHHRDFMPGEPIVSNIVGAIKKSRKTLVLLSKNFLKSYWCRYELHMAQMESISTGRDIIIIIMYESVPAKNIPPEFLHLLQSDSYIEYPHDESNKDVFWTHLTHAVRHRSHRPSSLSSLP